MRVQLVDPSAFTPPYDRALAAALARAGAEVELLTSHFLYGPVPEAEGYRVRESFYRRSAARGLDARARRAFKLAEHLPDMLRLRRQADADVLHYQWLTLPGLDSLLLPPRRPRAMTAHYVLPPRPSRRQLAGARRAFGAMDATIAHSEHGARRLREVVGLDPARVHTIHHGAFDYLTRLPEEKPLPAELRGAEGPVILFFGLLRPYKGVDTLLRAFRRVRGAELWIVGNPRMDLAPLRDLASEAPGRVRFLPRFVEDAEIPALDARAPTSSPCRIATSSTAASSMRRSPSASRWSSARSAASRRLPSRARPASSRPRIRRRWRRPSPNWSGTRPPARSWAKQPHAPPPAPTPGTRLRARPSRSTANFSRRGGGVSLPVSGVLFFAQQARRERTTPRRKTQQPGGTPLPPPYQSK